MKKRTDPPLPVQWEILARVKTGHAEITRERVAAADLKGAIEAEVDALVIGAKKVATR